MQNFFSSLLFLLFFLSSLPSFSQYNQANIWYFEGGNGINFNTNPPTKTNDNVFSLGRISTICDNNGKLLFYTDGMTVIDKNHKKMKNGENILGHAEHIIVPFPQNKNLYYIFSVNVYDSTRSFYVTEMLRIDTIKFGWNEVEKKRGLYNQKTSSLYYHIVDMSKNNGLGEVIEKNKFLYKKIKVDLVVARHANNKDFWLISHEFMTNKFKVFLINEKGLQKNPIETEMGMKFYDESNIYAHTVRDFKQNTMAISQNFQKIAFYDKTHKKIQVFDFDNENGKITKFVTISIEEHLKLGWGMNLEFSPDGTKLYVLCNRYLMRVNEKEIQKEASATIFQYNLLENDIEKTKKSKGFYHNNPTINRKEDVPIGDFRIAPNGKMYFIKCNRNMIGSISNANNDLDSTKIDKEGLKFEKQNMGDNLPKVAHLLPPFYNPIKLGDLFQREILFETGKYDLKTWHYPILQDIVKFLKENPKTTINIFGHTDNEGNAEANKTLSLQRAKAVESYFMAQQISKNRIISEGFGDTKPLLENSTPENKRKNRRIEFLVK